MKRRIVFINQATGYLTIDIVNAFARKFEEVALITGSIRVQETELSKHVHVSKIAKYDRGNSFRKGLSWIIGTIQINFLLWYRYRHFERYYFTIPPTAYLFAPLTKTAYAIAIFDLYPDALKIHNFNTDGLIYRWWAKRNRRVFGLAKNIVVLSDNMRQELQRYTDSERVSIIPNWTSFSGFKPVSKDSNPVRQRESLQGKFVVQYSGNIGATHKVETILEVADQLSYYSDIEFQIIGRGDRVNTIKRIIEDKGIKNCKLLPFRPDSELYESLCAADLAIVTLDERTKDVSVPSKVYNLMAAGVPIMAIATLDSAICDIVEGNKVGKVFEVTDIEGMKRFIIELHENEDMRNGFAQNSFRASKSYTSTNAEEYLRYYTA
jgi:glycosyltransferase involved in cell wall biosynthesis